MLDLRGIMTKLMHGTDNVKPRVSLGLKRQGLQCTPNDGIINLSFSSVVLNLMRTILFL